MRILVVIAHYFSAAPTIDMTGMTGLGSTRAPLAKIAAVNSAITALHRYYGPYRAQRNPDGFMHYDKSEPVLDIVIVTAPGKNLLDRIDIDPSLYTVEYPEVEPLLLGFEAQRIMRERAGRYDMYAFIEDDLIVTDPCYFEKVQWFATSVDPNAMLMPVRYEMSHSGVPAKVIVEPRMSRELLSHIVPPNRPSKLQATWHGQQQTFRHPYNPHSGSYAVTAGQLDVWMRHPSFYDRDTSWMNDPLVCAATYAPGKVFDIYMSAEPNPWFLEIEHYGVRTAAAFAPEGKEFGEPPLLKIAEALIARQAESGIGSDAFAPPKESINSMFSKLAETTHELESLKRSRSRLAKALMRSVFKKATKTSGS